MMLDASFLLDANDRRTPLNQVAAPLAELTKAGRIVGFVVAFFSLTGLVTAESPEDRSHKPHQSNTASTIDEARTRARVLHETIHGALQVVHRDFFDEDDVHTLPSQSLEDVFLELERSFGVAVRWISVNAKALNVDHEPRDAFEKQAAKALSSDRQEYESFVPGKADKLGVYRHAGRIRLASQCQKCHVPNRTSNEDRFAGLTISMRVGQRDL